MSDETTVDSLLNGFTDDIIATPDSPSLVDADIAFMRSCGNILRLTRTYFPDMAGTPDLWTVLQQHADEALAETGSHLLSASEWSRGGWFGGPSTCIAAARLGAAGRGEDVLAAMALLSHGFDYYGGTGQSLPAAYQYLIPAIVSALTPQADFNETALPEFTCFGEGDRPMTFALFPAVRALAPGMSMEQRRAFLSAVGIQIAEEYEVNAMYAAAAALGLDPYALDPHGDGALYDFDMVLEEAAGDDGDAVEEVEMANLMFWIGSDIARVVNTANEATFVEDFPWTVDWAPYQTLLGALWPPDRDTLRAFIHHNG